MSELQELRIHRKDRGQLSAPLFGIAPARADISSAAGETIEEIEEFADSEGIGVRAHAGGIMKRHGLGS